ncbi:MAG: DUF4197 domain-containing protein [Deltaproteobacteria bacterium]|nr:DUF4197 domain-containing protein [Deltaproteobacteria bacterium]
MKSMVLAISILLSIGAVPVHAGPFDALKDLLGSEPVKGLSGPDDRTTISGLKEALSVGTENAVRSLSKVDGFLGNNMVKILLPDRIQTMADWASKLGFQRQVDNLILTMNRAAEAASPKAARIFADAIREMTFDDARGILQGGDTAATEFFKARTFAKLYDEFKPVVTSSMDKVGVAKAYKEMTAPLEKVPLVKTESVDLDHYVTNKALDGLFLMIGEEEKKIRTDPAARVTDLLKKVFGR